MMKTVMATASTAGNLKDAAKRRIAEVVPALEREIAQLKAKGLTSGGVERLLACFIAVKESDLGRFRMSEWVMSCGTSRRAHSQLKVNSVMEDQPASNELQLLDLNLARQPGTISGAVNSFICGELNESRSVLVLFGDEVQLSAYRLGHLKPLSPEVPQQQLLRTALRQACDEIVSVLTARSALIEEITALNKTHRRCNEIAALQESLKVHMNELKIELERSSDGEEESLWHKAKRRLFSMRPVQRSRSEVLTSIEEAHRRLAACMEEADLLALEIVSQQAFVTETTKVVVKSLQKHAPTFNQAMSLLRSYTKRIEFIENQVRDVQALEGNLALAPRAAALDPDLMILQYDTVVVLDADKIALAELYWLAGIAKRRVVLASIAEVDCSPTSSGESMATGTSSSIWLDTYPRSCAASLCALRAGWSPSPLV